MLLQTNHRRRISMDMDKHLLIALLAVALSACASSAPAHRTAAPPVSTIDTSAIASTRPAHDPRLHASAPATPPIASPVVVALDAATLAALPRQSITATAHDTTLHCDGIALPTLLRASAAMPTAPLRGAQLTRYVQVEGRDGYRVLFALAELDPTLGNRRVFLSDRCDGKPLANNDGPLRLIVPDDVRPTRWLRQVESITVIVAP